MSRDIEERRGTTLRGEIWRMALLFALILLPLWGFAELADEVHEAEAFVFDDPLLRWAHAVAGSGLDRAALVLAWLGYQGVIVADVALCVWLLARRHWREAAFVLVATVGSALLNVGAKLYFARERPDLWQSISPQDTFSFPSGHAMGSMTLAAVLWLLAWRTRRRWPVFACALSFTLLVGMSRVYLGVHYPSDILGGWTAALAWVLGAYTVVYRGHLRPWRRR